MQSLSVMRPYGSQYTLSENGTLAYVPAMRERSLMWVDRDGSHATPAADAGRYANLRLSPDGTMVAAEMIEVDAAGIWVIDLTRGGRTRLTSDGEDNHFPIWTSGGEEVAFCTAGDGEILLRSAPADGSRPPIVLARSPEPICPSSWSPNEEGSPRSLALEYLSSPRAARARRGRGRCRDASSSRENASLRALPGAEPACPRRAQRAFSPRTRESARASRMAWSRLSSSRFRSRTRCTWVKR